MGAKDVDGTSAGATRRDVLKKAAAAGAVVWTTPQILATGAFGAPAGRWPTTTTTTTQPTTTTTAPPPGGKTICGSVRFTTYKVIKWHFVGSGGGSGQRIGKSNFRSTLAHEPACLKNKTVTCGANYSKPIQKWVTGSEPGGGSDAANQNHGFTETLIDDTDGQDPFEWRITPPSGWTLIAASGALWKNGSFSQDSGCDRIVSSDPNFPQTDGTTTTFHSTTYAIVGNQFRATGYPHWVELVVAQ